MKDQIIDAVYGKDFLDTTITVREAFRLFQQAGHIQEGFVFEKYASNVNGKVLHKRRNKPGSDTVCGKQEYKYNNVSECENNGVREAVFCVKNKTADLFAAVHDKMTDTTYFFLIPYEEYCGTANIHVRFKKDGSPCPAKRKGSFDPWEYEIERI